MGENAKTCGCVIKHLRTAEERAKGESALQFFRLNGDTLGARFTLAQLAPCKGDR